MNQTTVVRPTIEDSASQGILRTTRDHFRLTWRLLRDKQVPLRRKLIFIVPLVYALIPFVIGIPDFIPFIGLLDDFILLGITTIFFNALCDRETIAGHKAVIHGQLDANSSLLDRYRDPEEISNLATGFFLIAAGLLAFGSTVGLIWLFFFILGFFATGLARAQMLGNAMQITERQMPELYAAFERAQRFLPPVDVQLFVIQNPVMNAFTFGYREPYPIVLTSELVKRLTSDELQAVLGHEIGHILFEHTRLVNLMRVSFLGLERFLLYNWNRSSEYSADAIAWIASGKRIEPVASALLKLASGLDVSEVHMGEFLSQLRRGNETASTTIEALSTHPFIINRIRRLMSLRSEPDHGAAAQVDALQPQENLVK